MASAMYQTPSPSQFTSAACHLELRAEWRTVRFGGVRYIALTSGTSGRLYLVRADLGGCACQWSQKCASPCSHWLAIHLADLEDDLRESVRLPKPVRLSYAELYPACRQCGDLCDDSRQTLCNRCSSDETYRLERQSKIAAGRG